MVKEHRRCDQILMQVMAVRVALANVAAAVVATGIDASLVLPADEARKAICSSISMLTPLQRMRSFQVDV